SAGHCVNEVVDADDLDVHIAACGVNQVIAADCEQITVSAIDHDIQLWICKFQSGSERNGAAVRCVKRIKVGVTGDTPSATDAGNNGKVLEIDFGVDQRTGEAIDGSS